MKFRLVAVFVASSISLFAVGSAGADIVSDTDSRASVLSAEPLGPSDAAVEDVGHLAAFSSIMGGYVLQSQIACAHSAVVYGHDSQKDVSPVGIVTAKDAFVGTGNCASPLVINQYNVGLGCAVYKYNALSKKYDILLKSGASTSAQPALAGQGANECIIVASYGYNQYPEGWVRGCVWFTQPVNTYSGRLCSAPNPVV